LDITYWAITYPRLLRTSIPARKPANAPFTTDCTIPDQPTSRWTQRGRSASVNRLANDTESRAQTQPPMQCVGGPGMQAAATEWVTQWGEGNWIPMHMCFRACNVISLQPCSEHWTVVCYQITGDRGVVWSHCLASDVSRQSSVFTAIGLAFRTSIGKWVSTVEQFLTSKGRRCTTQMWLQRTSDTTYCFLRSLEIRYNEVLLYLHMPAWIFWQSTSDLCCFHRYIFSSVVSVHLDEGISTLLPQPYLWPRFCILHIFSSLSFHTRILGINFLCHLIVVLNHMSITNNLCFGTHSSFSFCSTSIYLTAIKYYKRSVA